MTEAEWLAATDIHDMLEHLRGRASERKLRLFAVACCRRIWHHFTDDRSRRVIEVAERHADVLVTEDEWLATSSLRMDAGERSHLRSAVYWTAESDAAPTFFAGQAAFYAWAVDWAWLMRLSPDEQEEAWHFIEEESSQPEFTEHQPQSAVLRDLFGNPFRPAPAVDPPSLAWQGGTVRELARTAYDERRLPEGELEPARLAVLADALEDAGCADPELLGHLRGPGPHVRGCWAVDLVLGKE